MNFKKIAVIAPILFICLQTSYGQVTIGTNLDPTAGTLLNLKQNGNQEENSNSGLLLPRVNLEDRDELYPMFGSGDPLYSESEKIAHTGLIVYNLATDISAELCPGPYLWNGSKWDRLWEECIYPILICTDIYVTGYQDIDMAVTSPVVQIPYTLSSGSSFSLPAGVIGTFGNIVATVEAQTLNSSGFIDVSFSGVPTTTMDKEPFTITIGGSSCYVLLSVMKPPSACPTGLAAKAFVFQQGDKWYALTAGGDYSGYRVAQTIQFDTEEEALRHPEALQYCSNTASRRCIALFDRSGTQIGVWINMTERSSTWLNGIAEVYIGCSEWLVFYQGTRIRTPEPNSRNVGAVNVNSGTKRGYFGYTTETAIMSEKQLR